MREFSTTFVVSETTTTLHPKNSPSTHRNKSPATNDGCKQLATADVDVLGAERHEVVGCAYGIGRDVDTQGNNDQANGAKGGSSPATVRSRFHPQTKDFNRVPDDVAICCLGRRSREDSKQTNNGCKVRWSAQSTWATGGGVNSLNITGMTSAWTFCALGLLA
jgi:hypothetical protein